MLTRVIIPITNYEGDGIFDFHLYIESSKPVTLNDAIKAVQFYHERDSQYEEYYGEWNDVLESLQSVKDWPILGNRHVMRNTFIQTKFGEKSLSLRIIDPFKID